MSRFRLGRSVTGRSGRGRRSGASVSYAGARGPDRGRRVGRPAVPQEWCAARSETASRPRRAQLADKDGREPFRRTHKSGGATDQSEAGSPGEGSSACGSHEHQSASGMGVARRQVNHARPLSGCGRSVLHGVPGRAARVLAGPVAPGSAFVTKAQYGDRGVAGPRPGSRRECAFFTDDGDCRTPVSGAAGQHMRWRRRPGRFVTGRIATTTRPRQQLIIATSSSSSGADRGRVATPTADRTC
jgi:hypothetical protein